MTFEIIDHRWDGHFSQHEREIVEFTNFLMERKPHNILEIGTAHGGTFWIWCNIATGKKISLDWWPKGNPNPEKLAIIMEKFPDTIFIYGNSHLNSTKNELEKTLNGEKLDFLFIDGDHSFEGVKLDYIMYSPFVRKGGIIALHDINNDFDNETGKIKPFWNELNRKNRIQYTF